MHAIPIILGVTRFDVPEHLLIELAAYVHTLEDATVAGFITAVFQCGNPPQSVATPSQGAGNIQHGLYYKIKTKTYSSLPACWLNLFHAELSPERYWSRRGPRSN